LNKKKAKKLINGQLVEAIWWLDSSGRDGWHEDGGTELGFILSVGMVFYEDVERITITSHLDTIHGGHCGDMSIPKVSILKRDIIGKYDWRLRKESVK